MNYHRRTFLKQMTGFGGALLLPSLYAKPASKWLKQPGLELYTVRDLLAKDFEGTIAKVAEIGYREVEPVGYGNLDPKQFRALLDRYKLTAPSTHAGVTEGPDLEKQLEGQRIMGIKYTEIHPAQGGGGRGPKTVESVKKSCAEYNRRGKIAKQFGMKILIHNHAGEFKPLENSSKTQYDILLAETDPALIAMQLDIGWAIVAGQDPLALFRNHPGRFELWHVKDVAKDSNRFVPVGQGRVNYRAYFEHARESGLAHYAVEQDNAAEHGADSMAAAKASIEGLRKILA
ncbi:MAG: sugar phosphate isomerase/epimerase [Bryobacterales bacterium]|nr:sugar phosphate isomerase/epimerase [Bryobacterales bacterium]